jgi:hypothetical protein
MEVTDEFANALYVLHIMQRSLPRKIAAALSTRASDLILASPNSGSGVTRGS